MSKFLAHTMVQTLRVFGVFCLAAVALLGLRWLLDLPSLGQFNAMHGFSLSIMSFIIADCLHDAVMGPNWQLDR